MRSGELRKRRLPSVNQRALASTEAAVTESWETKYAVIGSLLLHDRLVANGEIYPRWIGDRESFWYERWTVGGVEYRVVDAASGESHVACTRAAVVAALARALGTDIDHDMPILAGLDFRLEPTRAAFSVFDRCWEYRCADRVLSETVKQQDRNWAVSPDGKWAAFTRDSNLWLRDLSTGQDRALTRDGTADYAYASPPAARRASGAGIATPPEGAWSPDSRYFLTLQVDDRDVPDLAVMDFAPAGGLRPEVRTNKTSLPQDDRTTEFRMLALDMSTGRQIACRYPRLPAVRMNDTPFSAGLAWWNKDGTTAYFVDIERGEKAVHVVAFDVASGNTRVVFSESAQQPIDLGVNVYAPALVFPLPQSDELIWYSERSGRGHLYLYDIVTGALKNPITQGEWQVREVLAVDADRREVFFRAGGIAPGESPYVSKPCIAGLDGGGTRMVSADPGEHVVWRPNEFSLYSIGMAGADLRRISGLSPSGNYFVETIGGTDRLPRTILRARDGGTIATLEVAEPRALQAGWTWPEPVTVTAADGRTELHGLLFKPRGYDPKKSYPVIDFIYGGPQIAHVPQIAFGDPLGTQTVADASSFAALGAFVLVLDSRGTACRDRAFRQDTERRTQPDTVLADHRAALDQLGKLWPAMDMDRVGITGFSYGGYLSALAMLTHGDFFKVAVAGGGNYDQALFWSVWGERYYGAFEPQLYRDLAARSRAAGLQGKLLLIHGLLDSGCHPAAMFQLVQALIENNKDFDMIVLPKARHELTGYGARRRLDYFVTHLFGGTPPAPMAMDLPYDRLRLRLAASARRLPDPRHD
jgi:dipeptidyl-peptidase 4